MIGYLLYFLCLLLFEINANLFEIIQRNITDSYLMSLKQVFAFNSSMYTDWSEWGKCSPERECSQIRYRECIDRSYLEIGTAFMKRCNTRFIIEDRVCRDDLLKQCQNKIDLANEIVTKMLNNCGTKETISKKIFGGKPAKTHKAWPWNVGLHVTLKDEDYSSLPICGGTLIAPGYILTAGHCISDSATKSNRRRFTRASTKWNPITDIDKNIRMKAVFNDYILSKDEGTEQSSEVEFYMTHPKYNLLSTSYDIAILKLKDPIDDSSVTPACLPRADVQLPAKTNCYAVGWGYINNASENDEDSDEDFNYLFARILSLWGRPLSPYRVRKQSDDEDSERIRSDELLEVSLPLKNLKKCEDIFSDLDPKAHICAGKKGSDTCKGDSGGGLYCQDKDLNNKWVNYGITSYGSSKGCGLHHSIYTSVAGSRKWIESVILKDVIASMAEDNDEA